MTKHAPGEEEVHHPEGVTEKDLAYRAGVKERIMTGEAPAKTSAVTLFANHLSELGVRISLLSPQGIKYACGCEVVWSTEARLQVCEGHR